MLWFQSLSHHWETSCFLVGLNASVIRTLSLPFSLSFVFKTFSWYFFEAQEQGIFNPVSGNVVF